MSNFPTPVMSTPPPMTDGFNTTVGGWLGDAFSLADKYFEASMKYEQVKQAKDANGQGQHELLNGITRPTQNLTSQQMEHPNAKPSQPSTQWINGVDNKVVMALGGLATLVIVSKVL